MRTGNKRATPRNRKLPAETGSAASDELAPIGNPPLPTSLERRAAYRFSILSSRYANALAEVYTKKFGLTMADWKTLAIIGHYEPIHPGAICAHTSMVPEGVSRALDRLVSKDVIIRSPDEHDRRRVVVTLSKKGRSAFAEIEKSRAAMEDEFLSVLSAGERETLFDILEKLDAHAHRTLPG